MDEFVVKNQIGEDVKCIILARFNLNKKEYIFYTDNYQVYVGYIYNKKINKIVNDEEFNLINKIYNELKRDKQYKENLIELSPILYNGELYKTIYDKINKKRYFYHLINNRYVEAVEYIKNYLDSKYNKEITIFNANNHVLYKEPMPKKKRKLIKIGALSIMIIITGVPLIGKLLNGDLQRECFNNTTEITQMNEDSKYVSDETINYLLNNNSLSQDDKEFIKSIKPYFEENGKFIDIQNAKWNLSKLTIDYQKNEQTTNDYKDNVSGYYSTNDDKIVILNANSVNDSLDSKKMFLHELTHAISDGGFGKDSIVLTEGITELLANEYLESYSDGYIKEQTYARILCEILGEENVRDAFFKGDINSIVNDLSHVYGNPDDGLKFISLINDENICEETIKLSSNDQEITDAKNTLKEITPVIDSYIKTYYEHKTNTPLNKNELMNAYMDSLRGTNNFNNKYTDIKSMNVIKQYFNSKTKDDNVYVEYLFNGQKKPVIENYHYSNASLNNDEYKKVM